MAYVDLSGNDANQIRGAYQGYLGRAASDDEVSGWLSGGFGGGGLSDWLNQIANSGEAQQRQQSKPPGAPPSSIPDLQTQPGINHGYNDPDPNGGSGPSSNQPDAKFAGGLNQAYQQYLGRQASADEIANWWNGAFGYGQGWSGYNQFTEAIRNSGEAKSRNAGVAPSPLNQSLEYWTGQGVKDSDIFDLATGQLKPGWERYEGGYRRTGGTTGTTSVVDPGGPKSMTPGDVQSWFMQLVAGKAPSPQALEALEPILNKYGIKLGPKNARGFNDGIILPDGTFYDVITGATTNGGSAWSFFIPSPHTATPTPSGPYGPAQPGNQYSDPYTAFYEQMLKDRIAALGPINDVYRQQYQDALSQRAQTLATGNAQLDQLLAYLQERFTDLKGSGYTGAENEVLRTAALDPMERDRTAAKQRLTERLAAMGHTPESGVFQDAMRRLDTEFDGMRAVTQTQLATNELGRRENRNQRAESIAAQLADIPELRSREQLDVFQALTNLSQVARSEDDARAREAITYGSVLNNLGPERLQLAMQAAGMGSGNTSSLSSLLTSIAGLNQNASAYNASNQSSLWSGLGSLAAIIARSGNALGGAGI